MKLAVIPMAMTSIRFSCEEIKSADWSMRVAWRHCQDR